MVLMALALVFAFGAFPSETLANYTQYSCANPFTYPNGYYYCPNRATVPVPPPVVIQQPVYQQPIYQALTATCYPSNTSGTIGNSVQWLAYASGGNGSYAYNWNGTDGFTGTGQATYMTYYSSGIKSASVTIYSGAQSIVVNCTNSVSVMDPYYNYQPTYIQQPIYNQGYMSNNAGLDIGCYVDPASTRLNTPVTWNVEVVGGMAPYTYSWTGSDGLSGQGSSIVKYYDSYGSKSAVVTVTSADGKTGVRACSTTLAVRGSGNSNVARSTPAPAPIVNNQQASALFSLNNVPWGWVAVLVILVLFSTSMYLLFNKSKM